MAGKWQLRNTRNKPPDKAVKFAHWVHFTAQVIDGAGELLIIAISALNIAAITTSAIADANAQGFMSL